MRGGFLPSSTLQMSRAGGAKRRAVPHPHAQVAKRLRATHDQAQLAAMRAQAMLLGNILLPVLRLSTLQSNAVTPAVANQYDHSLMEFILWLREQQVHVVRTCRGLDTALVKYFDALSEMLTLYSAGKNCWPH